jgi:hypothetical protein
VLDLLIGTRFEVSWNRFQEHASFRSPDAPEIPIAIHGQAVI